MSSLRWLVVLGASITLIVLLYLATRPPPLTVQGEVTTNRVDISPRVSGRVAKLVVDVGNMVEPNEIIAELESPELSTQLLSSQASVAVAKADYDRVHSTRPETIAARQAEVAAAKADVTLAQETYDRQAVLVRQSDTPQAKLDEATRNLESALRKMESAEANLTLVTTGSSKEEKALSAAQLKQSEATYQQRVADVAELTIRSPMQGQVITRSAELGENFSAGAPMFSLVDIKHPWFTFNLREDLLSGLKVGDEFELTVPAFQNLRIPVRVTLINAQGQFATWRATRATGDFDLRTFEVRAVAKNPVDGLRPGMSAIAIWPAR